MIGTYYTKFSEWKEVRDWCELVGEIKDKYGNRIYPKELLYDKELTQSEFDKRKIEYETLNPNDTYRGTLWYAPIVFDYWLIRNCETPPLIVDKLNHQYPREFIDEVINETTLFDTYKRNGLGNKIRVSIKKRPKFNYRGKVYDPIKKEWQKQYWWISVGDGNWNYDEAIDYWYPITEPHYDVGFACNCYIHPRYLSFKTLMRKLKKWNLPKGVLVSAISDLDGQSWELITK